MTKEFENNYKDYLEEWGLNAQILMAIEEMGELTKELCKYLRYNSFESDNEYKINQTIENLKSEVADVLNTVEQIEYCFGESEIEEIRKQKINRTNKLLGSRE